MGANLIAGLAFMGLILVMVADLWQMGLKFRTGIKKAARVVSQNH
jgi:hypothetical protein